MCKGTHGALGVAGEEGHPRSGGVELGCARTGSSFKRGSNFPSPSLYPQPSLQNCEVPSSWLGLPKVNKLVQLVGCRMGLSAQLPLEKVSDGRSKGKKKGSYSCHY